MRSLDSFIVTPKDKRYKSPKQIGGFLFETVLDIEDAKDVSKEATVVSVPMDYKGEIEPGDEVIIHHNIFRMYYNQQGDLSFSRAYLYDDYFQAIPEEVFLYKKNGSWYPNLDFCFVEPIEEDHISIIKGMVLPHTGKIAYSNKHKTKSEIGFTPESEYEVWVDGKMYYRMKDKDICLYERFK